MFDRHAYNVMVEAAKNAGMSVDELAARAGLPKGWRNGRTMYVGAKTLRLVYKNLGFHPLFLSPSALARRDDEPVDLFLKRWCMVFFGRSFMDEVEARGGSRFVARQALNSESFPDPSRSKQSYATWRAMRDIVDQLEKEGMKLDIHDPAEGHEPLDLAGRVYAAGLTQAQLADKLGVTRQAVNLAIRYGVGRLPEKIEEFLDSMEESRDADAKDDQVFIA